MTAAAISQANPAHSALDLSQQLDRVRARALEATKEANGSGAADLARAIWAWVMRLIERICNLLGFSVKPREQDKEQEKNQPDRAQAAKPAEASEALAEHDDDDDDLDSPPLTTGPAARAAAGAAVARLAAVAQAEEVGGADKILWSFFPAKFDLESLKGLKASDAVDVVSRAVNQLLDFVCERDVLTADHLKSKDQVESMLDELVTLRSQCAEVANKALEEAMTHVRALTSLPPGMDEEAVISSLRRGPADPMSTIVDREGVASGALAAQAMAFEQLRTSEMVAASLVDKMQESSPHLHDYFVDYLQQKMPPITEAVEQAEDGYVSPIAGLRLVAQRRSPADVPSSPVPAPASPSQAGGLGAASRQDSGDSLPTAAPPTSNPFVKHSKVDVNKPVQVGATLGLPGQVSVNVAGERNGAAPAHRPRGA